MKRQTFSTIDEYIGIFPPETQKILEEIRSIAKKLIPEAEEGISYGIPVFKRSGKYVVYFAGFKNHVSLYPIPEGSKEFQKLIEPYVKGKGTVQFSLSKEIPYSLIREFIATSVKAHEARMKTSKK